MKKAAALLFLFPYFLFCDEMDFKKDEHQMVSIVSENDAYSRIFVKNNEKMYIGHYLSYTSKEFDDSFLNKIKLLSYLSNNSYARFNISLNQEIYTPINKYSTTMLNNDIPYGAALFASLSSINRTKNFVEQLGVDIGSVGPLALGKQTQNFIDKITSNAPSLGWNNQIKNEFLLNLNYGVIYRWNFIEDFFDILPQGQIFLGNGYTAISAGAKMRIGYGMKNDFGIQKYKSSFSSIITNDGFKMYFLTGVDGSIVGRNIFIQGNTFGGLKSGLTLNPFVYDFEVGFVVGYKNISLSYLFTRNSKEFKEQINFHNYGSIRLDIIF